MVSGGDFWAAYMRGLEEYNDAYAAGEDTVIDVYWERLLGVLPMPL
jgi:hypothetical protein